MSQFYSPRSSSKQEDEKYEQCQRQVQQLQEDIEKLKDTFNMEILKKQASKKNSQKIPQITKDSLKFKISKTLDKHEHKVYDTDWSSNSSYLLSLSQDGHLNIWNPKTGKLKKRFNRKNTWLMSGVFSPSIEMVACGGLDNLCSIYSLKYLSQANGEEEKIPPQLTLQHHEGYIACIKYLNNEKIITASGDSTCCLWDIEKHKVISSFLEHSQDCTAVSVQKNNQQIFLSASVDAMVKLWDIRQKKCVGDFGYHEADVTSIEFYDETSSFVSGSEDSTCILTDIKAYKPLNIYQDEDITSAVTSVSLSKSGRLLFCGYDDDPYCLVWDTAYAQQISKLSHPPIDKAQKIATVQVSPDGNTLCTSSWDCLVRLWKCV